MTSFSWARKYSSTAFFNHWCTIQSPRFSATRSTPLSSRPMVVSRASRSSREALLGVISARFSKAASTRVCSCCVSLMGSSCYATIDEVADPRGGCHAILQRGGQGQADASGAGIALFGGAPQVAAGQHGDVLGAEEFA